MRPVTVSVGPSLASTANDIATSQTPAVAAVGSAAATFTSSSASIAATNSFIAGQPVTFYNVGGSANTGSVGVVGLPPGLTLQQPYYVVSSGLSSTHFEVAYTPGGTAITFTGAGTGTQYVAYGPNVALNGSLVNSSGVAVLTHAQRVLITTTDTTTKFTITGTDAAGNIISETLTNSGTSVQSALDYLTVTSITTNQGTTAAITVGTNGVGSTPWVRCDEWANTQVTIQIDVTGTVNYTVQSTLDDPNSATNSVLPSAVDWVNSNDTNVVGATSTLQTNYLFSPTFVRCLLNSGSGSCTMTVAQANVANR